MQGNELAEARQSMGLTQDQLAKALGMTRTYVGLMERGEKAIEQRTAWLVRLLALEMGRCERLRVAIAKLEKGEMSTSSDDGRGWYDTTQQTLNDNRQTLASLERHIAGILEGRLSL